jgi:pyruvate/2-oxoglutarate dehydrogenase complex dihydrolipoamide dehydrogenase (E3) component
MGLIVISLIVLSVSVWTSNSLQLYRYHGRDGFQNQFRNSMGSLAVSPKKRPGYMLPDLSQAKFPDIPEEGYDLIVIGSGPAGEAAAVRAAKHGARVAIVEKKSTFGGPTGLTSKAVREAAKRICKAVDQIGGDRRRQVKGLWRRSFPVLKTEAEVLQAKETRDRLAANGVDLFVGTATLLGDNEATFSDFWGDDDAIICRICKSSECVEVATKNVVVASGSRPNRPAEIRPG